MSGTTPGPGQARVDSGQSTTVQVFVFAEGLSVCNGHNHGRASTGRNNIPPSTPHLQQSHIIALLNGNPFNLTLAQVHRNQIKCPNAVRTSVIYCRCVVSNAVTQE
ncbi:hypothetical protein ElyMa_005999200 [Elysia marginata]|uniref:Uncharacterized protein n=1 Tax=Elysia marginata TaxID=1093978 RepID=A0AAV4GGH2_9GAST|nr:hypothetical protein ElyMa_005999200 [Elysia marginata]